MNKKLVISIDASGLYHRIDIMADDGPIESCKISPEIHSLIQTDPEHFARVVDSIGLLAAVESEVKTLTLTFEHCGITKTEDSTIAYDTTCDVCCEIIAPARIDVTRSMKLIGDVLHVT